MAQVSRQIGWSQESNLLYQILNQLNKLTSVLFGLKPKYKVYTALLTQSGGDQWLGITSGELTIGVTYYIETPTGNPDFTNVGAPNNNFGTYFVATGTTPNSWGTGGCNLAYNTGAPVVTVLENTIGNIWFTYSAPGEYYANSDELFTVGKTWGVADATYEGSTGTPVPTLIDNAGIFGANPPLQVGIRLKGGDYGGDSLLNNTPIEIRVYN